MANVGIDARLSSLAEPSTYTPAALIAASGPRETIARLLDQDGLSFEVFDEIEALLELPASRTPGLIVLWVDDPASGLVCRIEPLTQHFVRTRVVLVCPTIDRWGVRTALAAGVAGVVLFDDLGLALCPSLRAVQAGQTCVPHQHWRQIDPPALSAREKQILGLVVMGYMNGQIADQLFLAESTVKSHLSSAFGKLGVRSRNEAATLILDPERGLGTGILSLSGQPSDSEETLGPS
jgi:DNA-binding NarL/FixJ family response regulator